MSGAVREIADLPGPLGWPLIGSVHRLLPPSRAHQRVEAWCERYGPVFACRDGRRRWLLLAGEDTTAHTLAWTVSFLAQRPEIQARLAEESASLLGDACCPADQEVVSRFAYGEAVLRESMRLKPVSVWDTVGCAGVLKSAHSGSSGRVRRIGCMTT